MQLIFFLPTLTWFDLLSVNCANKKQSNARKLVGQPHNSVIFNLKQIIIIIISCQSKQPGPRAKTGHRKLAKEMPVSQWTGVWANKRLKHAHTDNSILVNQYRKMQFMICGFDWPKQIAKQKQKPCQSTRGLSNNGNKQATCHMQHQGDSGSLQRQQQPKVMAQFSHHFPPAPRPPTIFELWDAMESKLRSGLGVRSQSVVSRLERHVK